MPVDSVPSIARLGATFFLYYVLLASAADAAEVSFGSLQKVYSGSPNVAPVTTVPANLPYQLVYGDNSLPAGGGTSEIVFNNSPNTLALSYSSKAFEATKTSAVGNYYKLGASARMLQSVEVTFVDWARAINFPILAAQNPAGYVHPLTVAFYKVMSGSELVLLYSKTENTLIPWRPETLPNGNPYTSNGYAFRANFTFPSELILPEQFMVVVSFNTQNSGFAPIGVAGPYNSLNIALTSLTPSVGTDLVPDDALLVSNGVWYFPSTGWANSTAPMIRLHALTSRTLTPPVNAGSYSVTATLSDLVETGVATSTLNVQKATAGITFGNLSQVFTGNPAQSASVATTPAGLNVQLSYSGSATTPTAIGLYPISAVINDNNYTGSAADVLNIQDTFKAWAAQQVSAGLLAQDRADEAGDPNLSGIPNLLKFAFCLPVNATTGSINPKLPAFSLNQQGFPTMVYRKNRAAVGIQFSWERSSNLASSLDWTPVTPIEEKILQQDSDVQILEATLPKTLDSSSFYRLKVSH